MVSPTTADSVQAARVAELQTCTGEVFQSAVAPFLSNKDLFSLSSCSHAHLHMRYDLGRWAVVLMDQEYEAFRTKRTAVPSCFQQSHLLSAVPTFDLVHHLGPRLRVSMVRSERRNFDAFAGVRLLDLRNCRELCDVCALGGAETLDLSGCRVVTDVSTLSRVTTLNLCWCEMVRDVSALDGVANLNLTGCYQITDVSALAGVTTLNLTECIQVWDVSALGGVTNLNLTGCEYVTDVSTLGNITTLNLSNCDQIVDVSALDDVTNLNLIGCMVRDIRAAAGVPNLEWDGGGKGDWLEDWDATGYAYVDSDEDGDGNPFENADWDDEYYG
jgi:hypothetical protein